MQGRVCLCAAGAWIRGRRHRAARRSVGAPPPVL